MAYEYYLFIQIKVQYKAALKIQTNIYKLECMDFPHSTASNGFLPVKLVVNSSAASQPTGIAAERGGNSPPSLLGQKYK